MSLSDMEFRKKYPACNNLEKIARDSSWSIETLKSPIEVVYIALNRGKMYRITVQKIEEN